MKGWKIVGASMQGTSHKKTGTPCQDSHAYIVLPDGTLVIAVSDGAGSAKHSDDGSATAVAAVTSFFSLVSLPQSGVDWMGLMFNVFEQARAALEARAKEMNVPLRELACTLWVLIVTDEVTIVARLGDGLAVAALEDLEPCSLIRQQKGEYANETVFLSVPDVAQYVEVMVFNSSVKFAAVSTDGLVRLAMQMKDWTPFAGFFQPLIKFITDCQDEQEGSTQLANWLGSDKVALRADDDLTLVLALRVEEVGS